ncbi:methyltransferase domain-containing protein [Nonomuraea diastatica]|uniref:methyltransferase domain-containing protein n=1 Tax=Nonomuraea diastatica TaxID=1848329 RepID=UPI00140E6873|nr:methyltransferase domain-containing protein [Nonomuraea diastatica]
MPNTHEGRAPDLASYLTAAGVLDPEDRDSQFWLKALDEVPRHPFVPIRAWMEPQDDRPAGLIDRDADPDAWWGAVYSNCAIITQRGDGRAQLDDESVHPTSSISCPHVAVEFLRLLDLAPHHHVLEIGTGTGWTAAMLSWRLGDDQVTTIDVDESVAAAAGESLKEAGFAPLVLVGDGALGAADRAPFDRVHVTCGVRDIPYSWVQQTRPGDCIVVPWMPMPGQWGYQLRLDVLNDGTAVGSFLGGCGFMMLRSQRRPVWPPYGDRGSKSTTRLDPRTPWAAMDRGFALALAAHSPHLVIATAGWEDDGDDGAWVMRLRDLRGDGWAIAIALPGEDTHIAQGGDRQLWHDLEGAYMDWLRAGRPGRDAYRMLVTPGWQDVRLA